MKRILVIISAFALSTGVAYAMDEDAMDKDMMKEAPSVSLAGSGALGFKNVDDGDDDTEDFQLIRAYKVAFSSSGTTDGGLVFGAGMSIRDDTTEENAPVVKGSNVFIGAGDGTWKLKLGGNDPGIEQAGGIGVADDNFHGGDNAAIGIEGAFGGTSYRLTAADPGATGDADGDWSLGVSHSLGDISVGVGMDSESGLALAVGSDISGVGLSAYYATSELSNQDLEAGYEQPGTLTAPVYADGAADTLKNPIDKKYADYLASQETIGKREWKGMGLKASIAAGEGATLTLGYSTSKMEQTEGDADAADRVILDGETEAEDGHAISAGTPLALGQDQVNVTADGDTLYALHTAENWNGSAKTSLIELEFSYDLGGGAKLIAGIDKKTTESLVLTPSHKRNESGFVFTDAGGDGTADTGDDLETVTYSTSVKESDETTLELKLAFTF